MNIPNKISLIAAAVYGISEQDEKSDKPKLLWGDLTPEQQKPFLDASQFLAQYVHGAPYTTVDRAKLASMFEKNFTLVKANANTAVDLFLNIASQMV